MKFPYQAAHKRLENQRGKARDLPCAECGGGPCWWALQYEHPERIISPEGGSPYSTNVDDYAPMCRPCHDALDLEHSPRKLAALTKNLESATAVRMQREAEDPSFREKMLAVRRANALKAKAANLAKGRKS